MGLKVDTKGKVSVARQANPKKRGPGRPKRTVKKASAQASSPMYRTKPSQLTGKKPSPRLMDRRARNTRPGTFPNPSPRKTQYVIFAAKGSKIYWFDGENFDSDKRKAARFESMNNAGKIARKLATKYKRILGGRHVSMGAVAANARSNELLKELEKAGV